jgi:aspartate kinase
MGRLIQKFDGGSFSNPAYIRMAAEQIASATRQGYEVTSVVSPSSQSCKDWMQMARGLNSQPNMRELNNLLEANEQVATTMLSLALESLGVAARSLPSSVIARRGAIRSQSDNLDIEQLELCMARGEVGIVGGSTSVLDAKSFESGLQDDSDLLAVALASALDAERCECFVENDGIFTADPKIVSDARKLHSLSYDEALELSHAGTQMMSADALEFAADSLMPLRIRSTSQTENTGTLVTHSSETPLYTVASIAVDDNMVAVNLTIDMDHEEADPFEGVSPVFARFTELAIPTDMLFIIAREDKPIKELGFVVKEKNLDQVLRIIESHSKRLGQPSLHLDRGLSRISIVGKALASRADVVSLIFEKLNAAQIPIRLVASGDLRLSLLLPTEFAKQSIQIVHKNIDLTDI